MSKKKPIPVPEQEISELLTQMKKLDESQKKEVIDIIDETKKQAEASSDTYKKQS